MSDHSSSRAPTGQKSGSDERYLCFNLGAESYALPLLSVREVIALPEIVPVPQTPPHFLGIMNLRGQVISVMDLRTKLSIRPSESHETSVIICDTKPSPVGVVVDSINSVISASAESISAKPEIVSQKSSDYIRGVFRENERLVFLLDVASALNLAA